MRRLDLTIHIMIMKLIIMVELMFLYNLKKMHEPIFVITTMPTMASRVFAATSLKNRTLP